MDRLVADGQRTILSKMATCNEKVNPAADDIDVNLGNV